MNRGKVEESAGFEKFKHRKKVDKKSKHRRDDKKPWKHNDSKKQRWV